MSELAYLRGVLTKEDLNSVQEAMLSAVISRKREQEADRELALFEQNMFVTNPAMYKEYKDKQRQEVASGNAGITWLAPASIEEAQELANMFSDIDQQLKEMGEDPLPQSNFLDIFNGINIDEIGGDD